MLTQEAIKNRIDKREEETPRAELAGVVDFYKINQHCAPFHSGDSEVPFTYDEKVTSHNITQTASEE
jgi:hypothetical protein